LGYGAEHWQDFESYLRTQYLTQDAELSDFGIAPSDRGRFLDVRGLRLLEDVGIPDYSTCYLQSHSRDLSVSEIERVARAVVASDRSSRPAQDEQQVCRSRLTPACSRLRFRDLSSLPIVTRTDCGHTDPMFVLRCGVLAQVDCDNQPFESLESAAVD
jgi:hypothetical protein